MQIYYVDQWGFYAGVLAAVLDPEETKVAEEERFLIPAHATVEAPDNAPDGMANRWTGTEWEQVEDNRGKPRWNTATKEQGTVGGDNVIPEGWTLIAPPSKLTQYYKFDGATWIPDTAKKQEVLSRAKALIDSDTDAAILTGWEFQGMTFRLSLENQINYKAEYELREVLTYPHRMKSIDGYYDVPSTAEFQQFYLSGVQYIRGCIEAGWAKKDALDNLTTAQLIDYINNRITI